MILKLHRSQRKVFDNKARFRLVVAGRRWGKTRVLLTSVILAALSFDQEIDPASPPVCLIVMPTFKQCRAIHWQPLLNLLEGQPWVEKIDRTDFRIKLKGNKPDIILRGADDHGKSLRGLKIYFAGLDEFQDFSLKAWTDVIYAALADTPGSKAMLIATPSGKTHFLYKMHLEAQSSDSWAYFHFITKDNPFVPRKFIAEAEKTLPPRVYRQEFEASFEDFEGQYFDCFTDNLIVKELPLFTNTFLGCDWGDVNPSLVVVGTIKPPDQDKLFYYLIDSWTNPVPGTPVLPDVIISKASELCRRYGIRKAFLPDDRPASILELRKVGKRENIPGLTRSVQVNRNEPGVKEGCNIINSLFYQQRLFVYEPQQVLADCLKSYRREVDVSGNVLDHPAKGQTASHLVDATRYAVASIEYTLLTK
ncbi:hypothetical protein H6G93_09275 [Nostoc sp. FACHB-973]|nr:hypothetical protein [Nostoc sp. FACHB-973]